MSNNAVDDLRIYYKSLSKVQRALFPKALGEKLDDENCSALSIFKLSLRYSSLHSPGLYQFYRSDYYKIWRVLEDNQLLTGANAQENFDATSAHTYHHQLMKMLVMCDRAKLLSGEQGQINFDKLFKTNYTKALNKLDALGLFLPKLAQKNFDVITSVEESYFAEYLAVCLKYLNKANLLDGTSGDENRARLSQYDKPCYIHTFLKFFYHHGLLSGDNGQTNFNTIIAHPSLSDLNEATNYIIGHLHGQKNAVRNFFSGAFGQANVDFLAQCKANPLHLAFVLVILNDNNILTPENRSLFAQNPNHNELYFAIKRLAENHLLGGAIGQRNLNQLSAYKDIFFQEYGFVGRMQWGLDRLTQVEFDGMCRVAEENRGASLVDAIKAVKRYIYSDEPARRENQLLVTQPQPINTTQSTHYASVHRSVSESARNLQARYGALIEGDGLNKQMKQLHRWGWWLTSIGRNMESMKVGAAKRCLVRLKTIGVEFTDPGSGVNMQQLLALCWIAIHDNAVRLSTRQDAENSLIEGLYEIQRGNNISDKGIDLGGPDDHICEGGAFNKLIQIFAGLHPDFIIEFITKQGAGLKLSRLVIQHTREYLSTLLTTMNPIAYENLIQQAQDDAATVLWPHVINKVGNDLFQEFESIFPSGRQSDVFQSVLDAGQYVDLSDLLTEFIPAQRIKNVEVSSVTPKQEDTLTNNVTYMDSSYL